MRKELNLFKNLNKFNNRSENYSVKSDEMNLEKKLNAFPTKRQQRLHQRKTGSEIERDKFW